MTTERISHRWAATPSWSGRASDFRRAQVRSRGPQAVPTSPTGPVESERRVVGAPAFDGQVGELWQTLVGVLGTLPSRSSAMICTADGFPVVSHGYDRHDLVPAARLTVQKFAEPRPEHAAYDPRHAAFAAHPDSSVDTVELTCGLTQTVIASIPVEREHYLLSITADSVSMSVLEAWTRETADQFRVLLLPAPAAV
ncbi:hypothetical protein SAMN04489844_3017 [Nocardioides exalbidus]|uniref:Roadblock/LAMTOR2 domain-containing protein n=1 Tax=Nocardioides exalbidus TaxID=402596 RepID=A0A1H4VGW0_9ACTN|nr:hypothetical protein [Nocardioides exalbidus]SEC80165.1 hypothetical protein SAMN04489844_3017 [Nocardioides exalbidus]